jgi:cation transport protein ChaC
MNTPSKPASLLSREMLVRDDFHALLAAAAPGIAFLSQHELDSSLQATLDERPESSAGIWVFAYGSLIWNCPLNAASRRLVTVSGWHRAFCLEDTIARGSREQPGLTMALDVGGQCNGVAFLVDERDIAQEMKILWRREMPLGTYRPVWLDAAHDAHGARVAPMVAFVADPADSRYAGGLAEEEIVSRLRTASGLLGSNADYLQRTHAGLAELNVPDPYIDKLVHEVARPVSGAAAA